MVNLTKESVRDYINNHGKRGATVVDALADLVPSLQVIFDTEIGREILQEDIERCEVLLVKIVNLETTDLEKIEFRYLRDRIIRLGKKLESFFKSLKIIEG